MWMTMVGLRNIIITFGHVDIGHLSDLDLAAILFFLSGCMPLLFKQGLLQVSFLIEMIKYIIIYIVFLLTELWM